MNFTSSLLKSSSLNLLDQGVRIVSVFIMTPVIINSLGINKYGYWVLLMTVFRHYALLDFGLSTSASRFFSRALGQEDNRKLNVSFNTTLQISVWVTIAAFLISSLLYALSPLFTKATDMAPTIRFIVALYGSYVSCGFITRVFRSLLKSHLRYDLIAFASVTQVIVGNTLIFFALKQGYGILALAILIVAAGFLEYAIVIIGAFKIAPCLRLGRKFVNTRHRREILGFSATSFVIALAKILRQTVDPIILASFVNPAAITYYNVGSRFAYYFSDLVGAVSGSQILVIFSRFHAAGQFKRLTEKFLQASRFSVVIAIVGGFSMMLYGGRFIERWMGPGFEPSQKILLILAIPFTLAIIQYPGIALLNTLAKHGHLAVILVSGGIFNIVLSVILTMQLGLYGVVWGTCIEMTIVFLLVLPLVVCRVANVGYSFYFVDTFAIPAGKTLLALVPSLLVLKFLQPTYTSIVSCGVFQMLYLIPLVYWWVLGPADRGTLMQALRPLLNFLNPLGKG